MINASARKVDRTTDPLNARVRRLLTGSLAALVSAAENAAPDMVMEESIREVDGAISDVQAELGGAIARKHMANKQLASKNQAHEDLGVRIAVALKEGREELAEAGIAAQLDIEAQIPVIESAIAAAGEEERELGSFIAALQAKHREMQAELKDIRIARKASAGLGSQGDPGNSAASRTVAAAERAFDRVLEREGGVAGLSKGEAKSASQLAELEQLARRNRIKERLAEAKQALKS